MQVKLTLRLDEQLIRRAKDHAQRTGRSVSQLVADYFALLDAPVASQDVTLPPITQSLYGILALAGGEVEDYKQYLEEKYR